MDLAGRPALARHYRLYAQNPEQALAWVGTEIERWLLEQPGLYVEIRDNVLLVFRPDQGLETPAALEHLFAFAGPVGGARGRE